MLEPKELLEVKARMLLAAEAARRIASGEESLELEPETYELVVNALGSLTADTRAVLTELDILRGMTLGSFDSLFGELGHGRSSDVAAVQPQESVGGGEGSQPHDAAVGGVVRPDGPDGEEGERPRPRRNRRRNKKDQERVES